MNGSTISNMDSSGNKTMTATIKFFSSSSSKDIVSSDSDESDDVEVFGPTSSQTATRDKAIYAVGETNTYGANNGVGQFTNGARMNEETRSSITISSPEMHEDFQLSSDDEGIRDREESIYDSHSLNQSYSESDMIRSQRQRTDSDSNMLMEDTTGAGDVMIIQDDHFGQPEDMSRVKEIELEIDKLKQQVFVTPKAEQEALVKKIVSLRLRQDELQEGNHSSVKDTKSIYGHMFHTKDSSGESERFCEVCGTIVWGVLQSWFACSLCHICCHAKCLDFLKRMCATVKVKDSPMYELEICPDQGLMTQQYKCFECKAEISYKPSCSEPRQCDYTGCYYCSKCHWNDTSIIPARVIHNWDFETYKVSRSSKQFLNLMVRKPVLSVQNLNPKLMSFVEELKEMERLREELLMMKSYFLSCQSALQSKLLLQLSDRQHFVENSHYYTMHDLVELVNEKLLPKIVNIHASFAAHIKLECDVCKGKGYYCELCGKSEILFPFDNICVLCKVCSNVFHKYCYAKNPECPRCNRRIKREAENDRKAQLVRQIELANKYCCS